MVPVALRPGVRGPWAASAAGRARRRTGRRARRMMVLGVECWVVLGAGCDPTREAVVAIGAPSHFIARGRSGRLLILEPLPPHRAVGQHLPQLHPRLVE